MKLRPRPKQSVRGGVRSGTTEGGKGQFKKEDVTIRSSLASNKSISKYTQLTPEQYGFELCKFCKQYTRAFLEVCDHLKKLTDERHSPEMAETMGKSKGPL